jgi:hypothetical protein
MPHAARDDNRPLASYVLRIRGRPAILRYELHDLRTGERRVFLRVERLLDFLRMQGLVIDLEPPRRNRKGDKSSRPGGP